MSAEAITTGDGVVLSQGDRAYNHYDMKPGVIGKIDSYGLPDTMAMEEWSNHWFDFLHDDGSKALLNGSRICSIAFAQRKGWPHA